MAVAVDGYVGKIVKVAFCVHVSCHHYCFQRTQLLNSCVERGGDLKNTKECGVWREGGGGEGKEKRCVSLAASSSFFPIAIMNISASQLQPKPDLETAPRLLSLVQELPCSYEASPTQSLFHVFSPR